MTVGERNLLIADFMGDSYWAADVKDWGEYFLDATNKEDGHIEFESFKDQFPKNVEVEITRKFCRFYDHDWNELMEVVEKIESSTGTTVFISTNVCEIQNLKLDEFIPCYGPTKIEATWTAVVEFIVRYNKTLI